MDVRDHLLATAAKLFQTQGYGTVSLRIIAKEAGVTTGSIYYYFKDKDDIVLEILDSGHRQVHQDVMQSIEALGPAVTQAEKIRVGIRAHLAALFENGNFPAANIRMFPHVPQHLRDKVRPSRKHYEDFWVSILSRPDAPDPGHARQLSLFLLGAANWTLEWYRSNRDSLDLIAANLARLFSAPGELPADTMADAVS